METSRRWPPTNIPRHPIRDIKRRCQTPVWGLKNYKKLNKHRDIRVVVIRHDRDQSKPVECTLQTGSLDHLSFRYEALSYNWGPMRYCSRPIRNWLYLDGFRFDININLDVALRRLRYPDKDRILWVDVLCINQKDMEEKNFQILLMRDIYAKAEQVVAWLGGHMLPGVGVPSAESGKLVEQAWQEVDPRAGLIATIGKDEYLEAWTSIATLLSHGFWTRVWTVQEISEGANIKIYYGPNRFEWEQILTCAEVWRRFLKSGSSRTDPELFVWCTKAQRMTVEGVPFLLVPHVAHSYRDHIIKFLGREAIGPAIVNVNRRTVSETKAGRSLVGLLTRHYIYRSTDPRDKIYALLGLAADCQNTKYPINYAATERQMKSMASSKALISLQDSKKDSLVPFCGVRDAHQPPSDWLEEKSDITLLDRIKTMLNRFLGTKSSIPDDEKIDAFWRTMIYNRGAEGEVPNPTYYHQFQILLRANGPQPFTDTSKTPEAESSPRQYVRPLLQLLHRHLSITVDGFFHGEQLEIDRRLYITKRGIIGLAEHHAQKGDLVCVLKGCFRPLLVKRSGASKSSQNWESERVIGGKSHCCTYLHGYMEGRAVEEMEAGRSKSCTFRLR
ncbi:MAG: hypothetical protein M1818_001332 [Claussenomyces sp. TS43310]|nr:MAG: hypothetical protein M1818_001332 [Claussenomyces sp. TS43310]